MSDEGYIELLWSKRPILLTSLLDILNCADTNAKVEDIEEIDVDLDGNSDDKNDGYE